MSTASYDYDLIVLGGGSAGLAGAIRAAQHGKRVAMLEPGELGGTCVNVGCVPKKAMWLAADLHERIGLANAMGFDVEARPALSWKELVIHRQAYISNIHTSYHKRQFSGVTVWTQLCIAGEVDRTGKAIMERRIVAHVVAAIDAGSNNALRVQRLALGSMVIEVAGITEYIVQTACIEFAVQRMRMHPVRQAQP